MYEIIRTFSPIFRGLNFENPRAAAIYYVNLIINFPTNLQCILNEAQAIYGNDINRQALHVGRRELQKNGIIGRTYFTEDSDVDFDRETYLPVNPDLIWRENLMRANIYWKHPEEMAFRKTKVKELYEHYRRNFKKYGIGIETGSITGLFNIYWLYRKGIDTINYGCRDIKRIDLKVNSLESYILPDYSEYEKEIFKRGLSERILFDDSTKILFDKNTKRKILKDEESMLKEYKPTIEKKFKKFIELGKDFHNQIEVRFTSIPYITNRQSIMYNDNGAFWACDFRKLLSLDPKEPPNYLGTIYLQNDLIDHIRENFEAAWAKSIEWNEV
ncbi:MAG: hypothetical protein PHY05_08205 [Methanothrix sp.]|nr:hypothetical protein [Methanothrix sp.]